MNYHPSFNHSQSRRLYAIPLGVDPVGRIVWNAQDLPELSTPRMVVVTRGLIAIDGWQFPVMPACKPFLIWLQRSARRWCQEDPCESNRIWVEGIIQAFVEMVQGEQ